MIASCFALASFAAALVVGIAADNQVETILTRAIVTMFGGGLVGLAIGTIAQRTVDDHIEQYKKDHPVPEEQSPSEANGERTAARRAA